MSSIMVEVVDTKKVLVFSENRPVGSTATSFKVIHNIYNIADLDDRYFIRMSVQKVVVPYSFYSVENNLNNIIPVVESDIGGANPYSFNITLRRGNYNVNELIAEIQSELLANSSTLTYNIAYDRIQNKLNISINEVGRQFSFRFNDTAYPANQLLGFSLNNFITNYGSTLTSDSVVRLTGIDMVHLRTSIMSDSTIDVGTSNNIKTLVSIPIEVPHFSLIVWRDFDMDYVDLRSKIVSGFEIQLTDKNGTPINLNGLDWEVIFRFDVLKRINI